MNTSIKLLKNSVSLYTVKEDTLYQTFHNVYQHPQIFFIVRKNE